MKNAENKEYTIRDIEALTEGQAKAMAEEVATVKEHQVYFVDFGVYFGYSALVFADGHHIRYADDYELHHNGKTRNELKDFYLSSLNKKLFTADEMETVTSYEDEQAKRYYIQNYYGMRRDHISMFFVGSDEERVRIRNKINSMIFSHVFLAYYDKCDADFVRSGEELLRRLEKAAEQAKTPEYWVSAFLHEMFDHEYGINWQADFDVCSCFGDCSNVRDYENIEELFNACNFSDMQRSAYMIARRKYSEQSAALY